MSCKFDWLGATNTAVGNFANSLADSVDKMTGERHALPYFAKIGTAVSLYNVAKYTYQGNAAEAEQAAVSFAGGAVAGNLASAGVAFILTNGFGIATGAAAVTFTGLLVPVGVGLVVGTLASWTIDYYYDQQQCNDDNPYQPKSDESPTQGYIKKYYDPIILDLDGNNGVGTVSKFGVLFMMNGGAMFDHDGDGIATQAGWVAVNDEWWEMVV